MDAANALINGLAGEKTRWTKQLADFADTIGRLVGDVVLACAFICYCGPTIRNSEIYCATRTSTQIVSKGIPVTKDLDIVPFLTTEAEMGSGRWKGCRRTHSRFRTIFSLRSSRWPLLIDPRGRLTCGSVLVRLQMA